MTTKPPTKTGSPAREGRPFKRVGRDKVSFYIERDMLAALKALQAARGCSFADAVHIALQSAVTDGTLKIV
jgi:hypothetical protein